MRIKFYAHASFRLEGDGVTVVTDPYEPGKQGAWFDPIHEPADVVLMSSTKDFFHCDPSHVLGDPVVLNALEIPAEGTVVKELRVRPFPTRERIRWAFLLLGALPRRNAMYHITFPGEGLRVLHTGDIGRPMKPEVLDALAGNVDILFAITGGTHNIPIDDMIDAIRIIQPRVVIPMHYYSPRGRLKMLPVTAFTERYPQDRVVWVQGADVELTRETLPEDLRIYVLEQSR